MTQARTHPLQKIIHYFGAVYSGKIHWKIYPKRKCICISLTYFHSCTDLYRYMGRQTNMKKELIHLVLVPGIYIVYTWPCCTYMWQTWKNWVIALSFYDWNLRQPNSTQFYWMKILFSLLKKNKCVDGILADYGKILLARIFMN